MSKTTVSWILLLAFLLLAMVITASAQPREVGVSEGNWFKYGDIIVSWNSNDPSATFPPLYWEWLEGLNETEWMSCSVDVISDTNVTCQVTEHFRNGSDKIRGGWIDIDTGDTSQETDETTDMTTMVISADLNENDTIYNSVEFSSWKINDTSVRTYPDVTRDTNHLNMTMEYSMSNGIDIHYYTSMNYYWDRSTGVIVEWSLESANQTGDYLTTWSALIRITESDVWVIPEFPALTSTLVALIVLTTATTIYKQKILKAPIH